MRRIIAVLLVAVFTVSVSGCATLSNKDYSVNGIPLKNLHADSSQIETGAGITDKETWWDRNWPYIIGGILVGGGIVAIVAGYSNQDIEVPAEE